jgi:hypothetical protein
LTGPSSASPPCAGLNARLLNPELGQFLGLRGAPGYEIGADESEGRRTRYGRRDRGPRWWYYLGSRGDNPRLETWSGSPYLTWLWKKALIYPLYKDNTGVLNYFDSSKGKDSVSDNPDNGLDRDDLTTLYYENAKVGEEFMNRQIASASDAMKAAGEFAATLTLPTAIPWSEL